MLRCLVLRPTFGIAFTLTPATLSKHCLSETGFQRTVRSLCSMGRLRLPKATYFPGALSPVFRVGMLALQTPDVAEGHIPTGELFILIRLI